MTSVVKKWMCAGFIFLSTFVVCGFFVGDLWYREDDLGQIINGLMRTGDDIKRVFSADEREFLTPSNYKRSKANVVSGFYRPIKHIFFTLIYNLFGLEPKAYFWFHVGVHALNSVLLFVIFSYWFPLWISLIGGCMFAFYPEMSWLTWAATLHNSLATLFLFLSFLCFYVFWYARSRLWALSWYLLSGLTFLVSICSRENGVFYPIFMFFGVFLLFRQEDKTWGVSVLSALKKTWIFFAVNGIYVLVRLWAYGIETLDRTYYNLFLRFPFLARLLLAPASSEQVTLQTLNTSTSGLTFSSSPVSKPGIFEKISKIFLKWASALYALDGESYFGIFLIGLISFLMLIFLYYAYSRSWQLFLFLAVGFWCFAWPGIVAYPSPRYINSAYPLFIGMIIAGVAYLSQQQSKSKRLLGSVALFICCIATLKGAYYNACALRDAGVATMQMRNERYAPFFTQNDLSCDRYFIVIGSPFVSDIESIFRYFLNDLSVTLVHEPFVTVAEHGSFGCNLDYRIKGVPSTVTPIHGGYRITSHDPEHCGLWLRFSDKPIVWSEHDKAYRWTSENYQPDRWYQCSLGKFMIHAMVNHELVSDMSIIIDKKWLRDEMVVVSWDTMKGRYYKVSVDHLENKLKSS